MTTYLNPMTMSKEEFLHKHGVEISPEDVANYQLTDHSELCVVCLVDNGAFTGAGVMDERDRRDFLDPSDTRPKRFYIVDTSHINMAGGPDRP